MHHLLRSIAAFAILFALAACTTTNQQPQAEPITVAWVSPAPFAEIDGTTTFEVTTSGPTTSVAFVINGMTVDTTTDGTMTIDMTNQAPGFVSVTAVAMDAEGGSVEATRTFQVVGDAPAVTWIAPELYETYIPFQAIDMRVAVADASGEIERLDFLVNGQIKHTIEDLEEVAEARTIEYRWRGFESVVGSANLTVRATNAKGLTTSVDRRIVVTSPPPEFVDRDAPRVWWDEDSIRNGDVFSDYMNTLRVLAEDNVRVAYFDLMINGAFADRVGAEYQTNTIDPRAYAEWEWVNEAAFNAFLAASPASTPAGLDPAGYYPDGTYTLQVVAVDTSGNRSSTATVTVYVDNGFESDIPEVAWLTMGGLYEGATVSSAVDLQFVVQDGFYSANDVLGVQIWVGGTLFDVVEVVAPFMVGGPKMAAPADFRPFEFLLFNQEGDEVGSCESSFPGGPLMCTYEGFDTTIVQDGLHVFKLVAFDDSGNYSSPALLNVHVDNVDNDIPTVLWWNAAQYDGKTLSGNIDLRAVASDGDQQGFDIDRFELSINGALFATQQAVSSTSSNYRDAYPYTAEFRWNSDNGDFPDGSYELSVVAIDDEGNRSAPAVITVVLDNVDDQAPVVLWYDTVADGIVISGTSYRLKAVGTDNVSITDFELRINSSLIGTYPPTSSSPQAPEYPYTFSYDWDISSVLDGDYVLHLVGIDGAGNRSEPAIATVTVSNTTVTVSATSIN